MKYTFHEKSGNKKGVVSNTHGFLNRHLDTGFKSKWSGFWAPPYKFLDYFAFRVNGVWLNGDTQTGVEYGEEMVFHHEIDSLKVEERISAPDGFPGIRVDLDLRNGSESKKAVQTVLEVGIDIRRKDEDMSGEPYSYEKNDNRLVASRKGQKLVIESEDIEGFRGEKHEKEHFPGEKQVCMVPERPVFRNEIEAGESGSVQVDLKTSNGPFQEIESLDNSLNHELGRVFASSLDSLENLVYCRNGTGIIAGHPWFQSYWARDSFWSLLGLIDGGYFETSRRILENFAENGLEGRINLDEDHEEEINRSDTAPLFVIAADKLRRHDRINEEIEEAMDEAMERLELDGEVVDHEPEGTWMDTLEREKAVDIQSLWLEAARIMEDERESRLASGMEKFLDEGNIEDELDGGSDTINTAIPLMFGHLEADEELEKINGEFSSRYGARTRSMTDPGYNPEGYHTGSVWGLTTCWAAAANLRQGNSSQGKNWLMKFDQLLDRDQPGALPEVVNAESGELIGAPEQAWSAGMAVHVIDSYLLGIEVEEDHVRIDPEDVTCKRHGKKIRGEKLDLRVKNGDVEILNDPDLDLRL